MSAKLIILSNNIVLGVRRLSEIEGIVKGGVIIPLKPLTKLEGKRVRVKILEVEGIDAEKLYSYLRLLREGEDAEEIFEI